jgi:hypothetical protein
MWDVHAEFVAVHGLGHMVTFQSLSLTEKTLGRSLVVEHGVVEVAERLQRLNKLRINLSGTLVTRPRIVEAVQTTLRAKLDNIATNAPKPG